MKEKMIVKVMNFHSLIRVDASRRQAMKYMQLEREISDLIDMIVNNRNFILDKTTFQVDETKPPLNIYFGSDYGFCGSINFTINRRIAADETGEQIIIGKKLHTGKRKPLIKVNREDFASVQKELNELLRNSIVNNAYSSITMHYYQFNNISSIEPVEKKIFPYDIKKHGNESYREDYYVEGDMNKILTNLVTSVLGYEINIAAVSSFASENIMRQNSTSQSLKKIEEIEKEEKTLKRKAREQKDFKKVIDSHTKKTAKGKKK